MNMKLNEITVEVRLKDTHFKNRAGEVVPLDAPMSSWHEVEFLSEDTCEHAETICTECADSWANEHWVRISTSSAFWSSEETPRVSDELRRASRHSTNFKSLANAARLEALRTEALWDEWLRDWTGDD